MKHTPAPLRILDCYSASFHNETPPRTETVYEVQNAESGETIAYATTEANANLIAAAPKLLEALAEIVPLLERYAMRSDVLEPSVDRILPQARAAIARVTKNAA